MPTSNASVFSAKPVLGQWALAPLLLLAVGLLSLLIPSYYDLAQTSWLREDNSHAPIIIALSFWLLWLDRDKIFIVPAQPAVAAGWSLMLSGLVMYVIARSQGVNTFEALAHIVILASIILLLQGWQGLRSAWFPLFFLLFMVPLPGTVVQAITMPLKIVVSIVAENLLHLFGYPIGRSGVILTVGHYQLMVADACSGLNSLFTLEALGLFYMRWMNYRSRARNLLLAICIIPISFVANVIRVMILVLVTYHLGDAAGQGFLHDFAGFILFGVALVLTYLVDRLLASKFDDQQGQRG